MLTVQVVRLVLELATRSICPDPSESPSECWAGFLCWRGYKPKLLGLSAWCVL